MFYVGLTMMIDSLLFSASSGRPTGDCRWTPRLLRYCM